MSIKVEEKDKNKIKIFNKFRFCLFRLRGLSNCGDYFKSVLGIADSFAVINDKCTTRDCP